MATGIDFNNAISVTLDSLENARVSSSLSEVYFKFQVEQGEKYRITTLSNDDLMGYLYDSDENQIGYSDDDGEGYNPAIDFIATETGTYYVMIRAYNKSNTIDFRFSLTKSVSREGDSFDRALAVTPDSLTNWEVSSELPEIYFKFDGVEGEIYSITTFSDDDFVARLYDIEKNEIGYSDDDGEGYNPLIKFECNETNTYYIKINTYGGASSAIPFQLSISLAQAMPGDSFNSALPIGIGVDTKEMFYPSLRTIYFKAELIVGNSYTFRNAYKYDVEIYNEVKSRATYDVVHTNEISTFDFVAPTPIVYFEIKTFDSIPTEGLLFTVSLKGADALDVKSVEIIKPNIDYYNIAIGQTVQLRAIVKPDTAVNKSVRWTTDSEIIASVDSNGLVTGLVMGIANISVITDESGYVDDVLVRVNPWKGAGTADDPYLISNVQELDNIRINMTSHFKQTADIDLSGIDWKPIGGHVGSFNGSYDGGNFKISNLTVKQPNTDYVGLFGGIGYVGNKMQIKNIHIKNAYVEGNNDTGILCGICYTNITNCHVDGTVIGAIATGGIVGDCKVNISLSSSSGHVFGSVYVGGLIGSTTGGTVSRCFSTANVTGIGYSTEIGGLIGSTYDTQISDCYVTGDVAGESDVGGLLGQFGGSKPISINNCYVAGNVSGYFRGASIISDIVSLSNYNISNIYILSERLQDTYPWKSYGTFGDVLPIYDSTANNFTIENCFIVNDYQFVSSRLDEIRFLKLATGEISRAQAMESSTYAGWDFNEIWEIVEDETYPTLQGEKLPTVYAQLQSIPLNNIKMVRFYPKDYAD